MSEERQFQTCLLGYEMLADPLSATKKGKIAPKCYQIQQDFETACQLGVISTVPRVDTEELHMASGFCSSLNRHMKLNRDGKVQSNLFSLGKEKSQ